MSQSPQRFLFISVTDLFDNAGSRLTTSTCMSVISDAVLNNDSSFLWNVESPR